jgi:hypothetical protein
VATATGRAQSLTAAQLKGALLTKVGTARPAAPAEAGDYGALPDVQTSKQAIPEVVMLPVTVVFPQATFAGRPGTASLRPGTATARPNDSMSSQNASSFSAAVKLSPRASALTWASRQLRRRSNFCSTSRRTARPTIP